MKLKPIPKIPAARWSAALRALPVISIRQPFAWLVVNGIKDIENRSMRTHHRGPILIHASLSTANLYEEIKNELEQRGGVRMADNVEVGGIVGVAEIVDCVRDHSSVWKEPDSWGWVLANARPLPFRECKGAVGFFYPKL
jgi:hypothetical protein